MSDLIERLRFNANAGVPDFTNSKLLDEAADRIEALEALEAALRNLLREPPSILDDPDTDAQIARRMHKIARAALAPERDK